MYEAHRDALVSAWNQGDFSGIEAHLADGYVRRGPEALQSDANSLEEFKDVVTKFRTAYPDANVTIDEFHESGDRTFVLWTFTGTNTGPGDMPPTGKAVNISGSTFGRIVDGKMTEELVHFDALQMMTQLGVIELPEG